MKILICVKQVPRPDQVRFQPGINRIVRDGVESMTNPLDLASLEHALALRVSGEAVAVAGAVAGRLDAVVTAVLLGAEPGRLALELSRTGADRVLVARHPGWAATPRSGTPPPWRTWCGSGHRSRSSGRGRCRGGSSRRRRGTGIPRRARRRGPGSARASAIAGVRCYWSRPRPTHRPAHGPCPTHPLRRRYGAYSRHRQRARRRLGDRRRPASVRLERRPSSRSGGGVVGLAGDDVQVVNHGGTA